MKTKFITFYFLIILLFFSCTAIRKNTIASQRDDNSYSFPPEWEEQEAVWLGWSLSNSVQQLHLQMAKAIHPYVRITILSRSDNLLKTAFRQLHSAGIDTNRVKGYVHYIPNLMIRDAGPRFLQKKNGELAIADFAWNNYGYPPEFENSQYSNEKGILDNDLAKQLGLRIISSNVVAEGGGLDMSSHVMISFKETALQRNPGRSIEEIEKEYLRMYGKQKMIWLNKMPVMDKVVAGPKAGNYFGYGANGHIDEFAKFVNDSTILISQIDSTEKDSDPVSKIDYGIMKENLEILNTATDIYGKPYKIIILPTPSYSLYSERRVLTDSMKNTIDGKALFANFKAGDEIFWLPAVSYCNFFITNGVVLLARYWQDGMPESERKKDEQALQILKNCFPERKIVQLNPMAFNRYGGGMHCGTQQQPKTK